MIKINLYEEVKKNLESIRALKGVENVVLTQRDGNPIQYSGVWFSKDEIFNVSASTAAIYNCALQLYENELKYVLIEGKTGKIMISPLRNYGSETLNKIIRAQGLQGYDNEFFIAITTQPYVNLGGILLKTRQRLIEIKKVLVLSGQSFKPPLKHYNAKKIEDLMENLNVKQELKRVENLSLFSYSISKKTNYALNHLLNRFKFQIKDLQKAYITLKGGFTVAYFSAMDEDMYKKDAHSVMSYTLFSTANKTAWLLKKMSVNSILIECIDSFQFIQNVKNGVFSAVIGKGNQKLGLLRLIIPQYCNKINNILEEEKSLDKRKPVDMSIKSMFTELIL